MATPVPAVERVDPETTVGFPSRRRPGLLWLSTVLRFTRRKPLGAIGGAIVLALLLMAAFAEWIAPYDYDQTIRGARMQAPSTTHWLGTDNLSRDMWSRVVYGARISVTVAFSTIVLGTLFATAIVGGLGILATALYLVFRKGRKVSPSS